MQILPKRGGVARRTVSVLLLRVMGMAFGYLLSLLVARWYGAEVLGGYVLTVTIVSILSLFSTLGLDKAVLRYVSESVEGHREHSAWTYYSAASLTALAIALAIALVTFSLREFLAVDVFEAPGMVASIAIGAWVIVFMVGVLVNSEALRAGGYARLYAFLKSAEVSAAPLLFVAVFEFFSIGDAAMRPVNGYLCGAASIALISLLLCHRKLPGTDRKWVWDARVVSAMIRFGFPVLISSSLAFIVQWVDTFMLGIMRTQAEVGIYNVSFKLAAAVTLSYLAVNVVITPSFARPSVRDDADALRALARKGSVIGMAFAGPAALVLLVFGEMLLGYFGQEFHVGYTSLVILTAAQVFVAYAGSVSALLNMTDHQRQLRNIMLLAVVLKVVLNLVLIPYMGIDGAAYSTAAALVLWNLLAMLYIRKIFGFLPAYLPHWKVKR
ncbi:MAG TPA: flippase [Gammaproteobacteria bacterium]